MADKVIKIGDEEFIKGQSKDNKIGVSDDKYADLVVMSELIKVFQKMARSFK